MPNQDFSELSETACDVITKASGIASALAQDIERVASISKDDKSPVTVADFAVQAIVGLRLRDCVFSDMVGEEDSSRLRTDEFLRGEVLSAVRVVVPDASEDDVLDAIDSGNHEGGPSGCFWTLDPIDGTKGFLRGGQFALALALINDGVVELGFLGLSHWGIHRDPSGATVQPPGSICMAVRGAGARGWAIGDEDNAIDLKVADWKNDSILRTCESVESGHSSHDASSSIVQIFAGHEAIRLDSQTKYAVVASGAADAYLRLPTRAGYVERIWDHAAGALVATESGAIVSDIHGQELDFSCGRGLEHNRGVICTVPGAHQRIIERISEIGLS
jgi:3'(2'), 5'-bisphosphate nucleotidase